MMLRRWLKDAGDVERVSMGRNARWRVVGG